MVLHRLFSAGLFFLLAFSSSANAQRPGDCLSDVLRERLQAADPVQVEKERAINHQVYRSLIHGNTLREDTAIRTIPVVVHIIHQGGEENISDELVILGIQHLNEAFANTGSYHQPAGMDTRIRFCLAQQDPQGMPTTGITRYESPLTNLISETQDIQLKNLVRWNPREYLNIWLVNEITSMSMGSNVAGYAYFPSSHGSPEDGIVNEARWFGSSVDNSKVHIHEAGHYLGLYHTFNGGCRNNNCLQDGDLVCDTPPDASTEGVGCNSSTNTCTTDSDDHSLNNPFRPVTLGGLGDQPDLFVNYMDYGFQTCQHSFTQGQADRMYSMLTGGRSSLLDSPGCNNACGVYASGTNFTTLDLPLSASNVTLIGYSERIVPHRFEWLDNGVVVRNDSIYSFSRAIPGVYNLAFRIYNSELGCYSEKKVTITLRCGTQVVPPSFSPVNPDPGQPVVFNSFGGGSNLTYRWYVNGILAGASPGLTHTFNQTGENQVWLITSNGFCADTSHIMYVPVGSCNRGEALTWWFGSGTKLTFYGQIPVRSHLGLQPFTYVHEGVSSICDLNGNLLLLSTGMAVYNGQGLLLENGDSLLGGNSSAQAALIVPNPSYNNLYYVFTTDQFGGQFVPTGGGLSYSVADMSLNNGRGALVQKNIKLMEPTTERLAAVKHCNGHDIWLVSHEYGSNAFYAYLVTDQGVSTEPVISRIGSVHGTIGSGGSNAMGCMKLSPRGDKLALTVHSAESVTYPTFSELFDFDNATGQVSNPVHIPADIYKFPYGVEFSPDGSKLYISNSSSSYHQADIFQYDLSSNHPQEILASETLIGTSSGELNGNGALQLAKNGSIYSARTAGDLDEIRYPNLPGTACGFIDKSVGSGMQNYGLPNQVSSFAADLIPRIQGPSYICEAAEAVYSIACGHPGNTTWNYTGPGSLQQIDASHVRIHTGAGIGAGLLTVTRDGGCVGLLHDTLLVTIGGGQPNLGSDTTICSTGILRLSPGAGYTAYLWQDGSTMSYLQAKQAGTYWVRVTGAGGCTLSDTIRVNTFDEPFSVDLGNDTAFCSRTSVTIPAPPGNFTSYEWSTGHRGPSVTVGYQTTLRLTVTNASGCRASDSIRISQDTDYPFFNFPDELYICPGRVLLLETGKPHMRHRWQDQSDQPFFTVWQPGLYWVRVTSACSNTWIDSVQIRMGEYPLVDLGEDIYDCSSGPVVLDAGNPGSTYRWQDGSTTSTYTVRAGGTHYVTVTNTMGCSTTDSILVDCPIGLEEAGLEALVSLYPNPAAEHVEVRFAKATHAEISVWSSTGQQVVPAVKGISVPGNPLRISCGNLAAGVYLVRIVTPERTVVKRLVTGL